MGRDVDIVLEIEERGADGGRSVLAFVLKVSGEAPESFTSAPFRRSSLGPRLFEELLPEALRRRLWSLCLSIRKARIDTTEAWIPWEDLRFRNPDDASKDGTFILLPTIDRPAADGVKKGRPRRKVRRAGKSTRGQDEPETGPSKDPDRGPFKEGYSLGVDDGDDVVRGGSARSGPRQVEVTSVVPDAVRPGASFLVEVVFHVEGHEVVAGPGTVAEPEASLSLHDGTRLTVRLEPIGEDLLFLDGCEAAVEWRPPAQRSEFVLTTTRDAAPGAHHLRLEIWLDRVQLARTYVEIFVHPEAPPAARRRPAQVRSRVPRSAFASYCRRDKDRVYDRVAALTSAGIDVFLDCLDIRQGADWERVLHREIPARDHLLLFWSCAASESEWVDKEWRYALRERGIDYILPNALEPPERCPPPAQLKSLSFGSVIDRLRRDWHDA